MKKLFRHTIVFLLVIFSLEAHCQLSGTYTIGASGSDYIDFNDAINDLEQFGIGGDVIFLVDEGQYDYFTLSGLLNPEQYNIIFSYNGPESDSAWIEGRVVISSSNLVTVQGFTFFPSELQDNSCFYVYQSNWIQIIDCHIYNPYEIGFDSNDGLLKISFPGSGPYYVAEVKNCLLESEDNLICLGGSKGSARLRENIIRGNVSSTTMYTYYYDNTIYPSDYQYDHTGQYFYGNTFFYDALHELWLQGNFYNNNFYAKVKVTAGEIIGNTFYDEISLRWANNAKFYENVVYSNLKSTFNHGIKFMSNYFFGRCDMNNDNTVFGNNFVFDTVSFSHGPGQWIIHNNFSGNGFLEVLYTSGIIQNNNLNGFYIPSFQIPVYQIRNNNFINGGGGSVTIYGKNATFYDPHYVSDSSLYSTNPALIRKGGKLMMSTFDYDIDSVERIEIPSIGANEICYNWNPDSVVLKCNDSLCLDLCIDSLENQYWSPAYLFADTLSAHPVISPVEAVTVYLKNINGSIVDSIYVSQGEMLPVAYASYTIEDNKVVFENESSCADHYSWDFGDGTSSNEESPEHQYPSDGIYLCVLTASNAYGDDLFTIWFDLVGFTERNAENRYISVYPNPGTDQINISCNVKINSFLIYDLQGRCLMEKNIHPAKQQSIDITFLEQGIYILSVETKDGTGMAQFVKMN